MANGLLGIIANPQIANVVGAQQLGQQQAQQNQLFQQQQQQLQQQQRVKELAGEILKNTLGGREAGGGFEELLQADPNAALEIMEGLGIPLDQPGRVANLAGNARIALTIAKSVGPAEAFDFIKTEREKLRAFGIETPLMDNFIGLAEQDPLNAVQELAEFVSVSEEAGILKGPGAAAPKQKTGSFLVRDPNTGETQIATGVFDPTTGTLETATASFGSGEVVSKLGETAGEESRRKVEQQRLGKRATAEETRASDLIIRGVSAAEGTATVRRALTLLDTVATGGIDAISFAVQRQLGIEGADPGELSNSLGKSVLGQLRETFGAAFTENEGKRLERIEASFTKSPATNTRLLKQSLRIMERTAKRARKAAVARNDQDTVDDIDDLLTFSLDLPEAGAATPGAAPTPGAAAPQSAQPLPPGLPDGTIVNSDGSFTLPTGERVVPN